MSSYSLTDLSDADLLRELTALVTRERVDTAILLAHLAEVDARRLYAPAGYSSMHAFCVEYLRFSDDAAFRRIRAARASRQFPILLKALSEGRLHLAAVSLIAPHLTSENVDMLVGAATHKRKVEIEEWLAERFPSSDVPRNIESRVRVLPPPPPPDPATDTPQLDIASEPHEEQPETTEALPDADLSYELRTKELVLGRVAVAQAPAAPRFHFQFVVPKSTHDKLCHAQALLSHAVPTGDLAQVFDRALDALIAKLEVRKLGISTRELRREREPDEGAPSRYIPASVRRVVWQRDKGRCTFVTITGGRCRSRRYLEFDHVVPLARGGKSTVANLRLRCSNHNQVDAKRAFGEDYIARKRVDSRHAADGEASGP